MQFPKFTSFGWLFRIECLKPVVLTLSGVPFNNMWDCLLNKYLHACRQEISSTKLTLAPLCSPGELFIFFPFYIFNLSVACCFQIKEPKWMYNFKPYSWGGIINLWCCSAICSHDLDWNSIIKKSILNTMLEKMFCFSLLRW